jgi:hypothetical protein
MQLKVTGGIGLNPLLIDRVARRFAKGTLMLGRLMERKVTDRRRCSFTRPVMPILAFANPCLFCTKMMLRPKRFWSTMDGVGERLSGLGRSGHTPIGHLGWKVAQ